MRRIIVLGSLTLCYLSLTACGRSSSSGSAASDGSATTSSEPSTAMATHPDAIKNEQNIIKLTYPDNMIIDGNGDIVGFEFDAPIPDDDLVSLVSGFRSLKRLRIDAKGLTYSLEVLDEFHHLEHLEITNYSGGKALIEALDKKHGEVVIRRPDDNQE